MVCWYAVGNDNNDDGNDHPNCLGLTEGDLFDRGTSNHFCSVTNLRVMAWELPEECEGSGSRGVCLGCGNNGSHYDSVIENKKRKR